MKRFVCQFASVFLIAAILSVSLSAQDDAVAFAIILFDPETSASSIAQIVTDGVTADVVSTYTSSASDGTTLHANPVFSPDGTLLLYTATPPDSRPQIYVQTVNTGLITKLTDNPTTYYYDAVWSPDGSKIAYSAANAGEFEDVYVMNADGTDVTRLTTTPNLSEVRISWAPDGYTLVYVVRDADLNNTLYTLAITGGAPVPLGQPVIDGSAPIWSPDGTRIYYAARDLDAHTAALVSVALDGSDAHMLHTLTGSDAVSPSIGSIAVAPDGLTIAFISSDFIRSDDGFTITSHLNLLDVTTGTVRTPQWIIDDLWAGNLDFAPIE